MATSILIMVAALSSLSTSDDAGLRRLIEATRQICAEPSTFGYSTAGKVEADAKAKVPKVLEKLLDVGLSASVSGNGERHAGLAQKDVGAVEVARLHCAEAVFSDIGKRYSLTNRSTGARVIVGQNPSQAFTRLSSSTSAPTTSLAANNSGAGDQAVSYGQSGGITANHIDSVSLAKNRRIYLIMLQDVYSTGQTILSDVRSRAPSDQTTPADLTRVNEWLRATSERIESMMTLAAAQSFLLVNRSSMSVIFNPPLNPAPSEANMNVYNSIVDLMPQYLRNIEYLMEHDTMDPQNQASAK